MLFFNVFFEMIVTILVTDFVAGFFHWVMDAYGNPATPVLGKYIFQPNREHHKFPRRFVTRSWFESASSTIALLIPLSLVFLYFNCLTWHVVLSMLLLINVNQIHKWTHRTPEENGSFITCVQTLRLVQTRRHHAKHHLEKQDDHYLPLTNLLNPLLDAMCFWRVLEWLIEKVTGIKPHKYG